MTDDALQPGAQDDLDNVGPFNMDLYLTPAENDIAEALVFLRRVELGELISDAMTMFLEANMHGDPRVAAAIALRQEATTDAN